VRMAAVGIGGIEKRRPRSLAIEEQIGEAFDAERGLVRMVADTDSAGAIAHCCLSACRVPVSAALTLRAALRDIRVGRVAPR